MVERLFPVLALAACATSAQVTETRTMNAPAREETCTLAMVQADLASPSFNQTWDVLGYVTLSGASSADPAAEDNRKRVRPRACAMGGTSVGVAIAASNAGGSSLSYIVLRPKQAPSGPSTF
ncbi:hypothetical protein BH11MYX3_BH11MYX3_36230 [soil metagenome]